jgi:hypothetical protein
MGQYMPVCHTGTSLLFLVQLVQYIHHQIAVIVTTSGDVNIHSSCFKDGDRTERVDKRRNALLFVFYGQKKFHLLKFIVSW